MKTLLVSMSAMLIVLVSGAQAGAQGTASGKDAAKAVVEEAAA